MVDATQALMSRIELLDELVTRMQSRDLFNFYEVRTLNDLEQLNAAPPAIAYVHEISNYFFMYPWSSDLVDTPYNSVIGHGWHNIDSPTPRYDRMIHVIHTQWLNGWNLDYNPDYIDTSQGGRDYDYLKDLFGWHHGPSAEQSVVQILPQRVTVDGLTPAGSCTFYIKGLTTPVNVLCTFTVSGATYSIVGWDTHNAIPKWIQITPCLESQLDSGTIGIIEWPTVQPQYTGELATDCDSGTTTIQIRGLAGPIDTSYKLILDGAQYQILSFDAVVPPTLLEVTPALSKSYNEGQSIALLKKKDNYNTTIRNMRPGDFVYRSQIWKGSVNGGHTTGMTTIEITGVETEIADKWQSSHNLCHTDADFRSRAGAGTIAYIGTHAYPVIDHEPSARSLVNYQYANLGQGTADHPDFNMLYWKPCGLPTTKLFLKAPLQEDIADGTEIILKNKHWYVVSVEHLGSDDAVTDFDTPQFPEGHKRDCFDYFHVASGNSPARFKMMLHVIASEDAFQQLFDQGKIIPGDLVYHQRWNNWYQILPSFDDDGQLNENEISFGDFARHITVHDRDEFDFFAKHFQFNNLWVVNNTHGKQSVTKQIITGFDADGNLTYSDWSRSRFHPAEFVYFAGLDEQSTR